MNSYIRSMLSSVTSVGECFITAIIFFAPKLVFVSMGYFNLKEIYTSLVHTSTPVYFSQYPYVLHFKCPDHSLWATVSERKYIKSRISGESVRRKLLLFDESLTARWGHPYRVYLNQLIEHIITCSLCFSIKRRLVFLQKRCKRCSLGRVPSKSSKQAI